MLRISIIESFDWNLIFYVVEWVQPVIINPMTSLSLKLLCLFVLVALLEANYQAPPYAEWAHSHVVWLNRNLVHDSEIYDLVKSYKQCS